MKIINIILHNSILAKLSKMRSKQALQIVQMVWMIIVNPLIGCVWDAVAQLV